MKTKDKRVFFGKLDTDQYKDSDEFSCKPKINFNMNFHCNSNPCCRIIYQMQSSQKNKTNKPTTKDSLSYKSFNNMSHSSISANSILNHIHWSVLHIHFIYFTCTDTHACTHARTQTYTHTHTHLGSSARTPW